MIDLLGATTYLANKPDGAVLILLVLGLFSAVLSIIVWGLTRAHFYWVPLFLLSWIFVIGAFLV